VPEIDEAACKLLSAPPTCPWCGAIARPNIMMFGDGAWSEWRARDQQARLRRWHDDTERLVVVELGAGTAIPSVRHFSHASFIDREAVLVRINPREPAVPRSIDVSIAGSAIDVLRRLDDALSNG
jgi:NAD-dependent SIR2 family protein deacetylase